MTCSVIMAAKRSRVSAALRLDDWFMHSEEKIFEEICDSEADDGDKETELRSSLIQLADIV